MKRIAVVAAAALVAAGPAIAHAAPKASKRTVSYSYSNPVGFTTPAANAALKCNAPITGCWDFSTVKGEKTVAISATDNSGTPVGLQVFTDGDFQSVQTYCGTATITVSPKTATSVDVRPVVTDACAGVPTNGTLTAVITKK